MKAARKPRAAATRNGGVGPKWDVERGLQLRKAGKTDAEIGAAVGASGGTVNAYARAHGWPKRPTPAQPAPRAGRVQRQALATDACWNCKEITRDANECHMCGAKDPHRRAEAS